MIPAILCYSVIGLVIGIIFSILFVSFDKSWKRIVSSLFSFTGSGSIAFVTCQFFGVTDQSMKFICITSLYLLFIISFLISMFALCKIIKDKDDKDALRIRDIILGQKSYIDKYYEKRIKEIDEKLNIPALEKREQDILKKESIIKDQQNYIDEEMKRIDELGSKKVKISLPEKTNITLTKEYIDVMASYTADIFKCANNIISYTTMLVKNEKIKNMDIIELKSYFIYITTQISSDIFRSNSNDVRVHFRYYNKELKGYDTLVAVCGGNLLNKQMTVIPYDENSLIRHSYECKRALIRSINTAYDYKTDNYTSWQDYMTYTFYNLKIEGIPFLSFGISVKNAERYKKLFYFLNFFMFEDYLRESVELLNEHVCMENIIYGKENDKNIEN